MREFFVNPIARFVAVMALILFAIVATTGAKIDILETRVTTDTVVEILVRDKDGKDAGHGSGSYLGYGIYLTAGHVAEGAANLAIKHQNGTIVEVNAVEIDEKRDVALLYIGKGAELIPPAKLYCDYRGVGTTIFPKGYPMSLGLVETEGKIVSEPSQWGPWANVYRVDAALGPGMSGGPVFDEYGYLIGINVGVALMPVGFSASAFGVNTIVPSTEVCAFLWENQRQYVLE